MDTISPTSRDLAKRLLARERQCGKPAALCLHGETLPAAAGVCGKLRTVLVTFAGIAGFRSLLTRSLTLTAARAPELKGVTVNVDGSLSGLENVESSKKKSPVQEWEELLVAQLLDLLVTFVGEGLMQQLVRQAWPDLPASLFRSRSEVKL